MVMNKDVLIGQCHAFLRSCFVNQDGINSGGKDALMAENELGDILIGMTEPPLVWV